MFAYLTFAAVLVFDLAAFVGRTWLHYHRTGDTGFRGLSGAPAERIGGVALGVGAVIATLAPLGVILGVSESAETSIDPLLRAAGAVGFVGGFILVLRAQLEMGASWRIGVDAGEVTPLVTRGVFAVVRNPIFTGMLLAFGGAALMTPTPWSIVGWVLCTAGVEVHVRWVEEPYLTRVHGDIYLDYARRVGRFVPGVGRAG